MKTIQKIIDINAHIENLRCDISVDNGNTIAKISFTNLGYGDITAIKFNACGYNSFGDIVPVNGKNKFFLIIQDIMIGKSEVVTDLKVKLPNPDIRKLDLVEYQVCYADGTVALYEGDNSFVFELEEIDDPEQLSALQKLYDKNAKFKPKDFEQGWICSCGRFNKHNQNVCSLCSKNKMDTIKICSDENLKKLIEEYKISEEKDKQAREAEQTRLQNEKKKRNIFIGIAIAVCIILAFPIGHAIQKSQGTKAYYKNEDSVLLVSNISTDHNSSYNECTGKVKNVGEETCYDVMVICAFKDSSGMTLDVDYIYLAESEGLAPGESVSFKLSVQRNEDIASCSILIWNYEKVE